MKNKIVLIAIFLVAALYRVSFINYPFWVDEFSSAVQARLINTLGSSNFYTQSEYYAEPNNILTHHLLAISFKILGESESAARLPFMLIGSMVPVLVFILSRELFSNRTAVAATMLSTTSYFMITWSRQARGYPLQQLCLLLLLYAYLKYTKTQQLRYLLLLGVAAVLGILTHYFFTLFIVVIGVMLLLKHAQAIRRHILAFGTISLLFIAVLLSLQIPQNAVATINNILSQGVTNNIWYYHALLWRHETVVTLLATIGICYGVAKKGKVVWPLLGSIGVLLFAVMLLIPAYSSRYITPVFPVLIIFAGFAISELSYLMTKDLKKSGLAMLATVFLTGFIITNGHMFTLKPDPYYSVNHVTRDIALVDYQQVYELIQEKLEKNPNLAVIETWNDRARWYLGQDFTKLYWFRWQNTAGSINGLTLTTPVEAGPDNFMVVPGTGPRKTPLISTAEDLERVLAKHPEGFIWIDDTSMPAEVISYAEDNFTEVLHLEHYSLDDNPYSIWPASLYYWNTQTDTVSNQQP